MAIIALQSASSGLSALSTKLDVIANNLANVNTDGFKASRANFQDLLYIEKAQPGVENANGDQRPTGLYVGLGVKVSGTQVDFTQGPPVTTDRELDLMIDGAGFFQVQVEDQRAPGGIAYTRAGNLTLNSDGELVLANDQGRRLEPNIVVPDDAEAIEVTRDGLVFVRQPGQQDPVQIGEIDLAAFINPTGLRQIGENLFAETAASGPPLTGEPGTDGRGGILQRRLEGSNVNPTNELINLIRTQRAFEMNSQTIRAADETLQSVAQLRR
ncbi:MAG: flagellar basal-body rod protein FlgG, partial [Planctomycetota bacterium]|nr:flagellar basal-body rod protein FlgG [Planctomycetota bacterium]